MADISSYQEDSTLLVVISGTFNFEDNPQFRAIPRMVEERKVNHVTIDLAQLKMIDSAALGMLMMLRKRCDEFGASLTLKNPQGGIQKIFEVSKFYEIFNIVS
tara:strand:- start:134 stop:442 length:309 start_codon:yes stop_codon:yes gene_type:complete